MARSRCPRESCSGTRFELKELEIRDSRFRQYAVQCSACGAVVGIKEYFNVSAALELIANKLGVKL